MRTSYIKDSDNWKKINQLYIKDKSIWTDVKEAYVKKDDQWRLWYVKSFNSMETLSLNLNSSGSLDVSVSGGSYYVTQPTEYRAYVDGVYKTSSSTTTISSIPITSGANRALSIEVWRGDWLLYTLTKSFRLFDYTGSSQSWVVPNGVSTLMSDVQGAQGGSNPGSGGRIKGNISVTAGNTIYMMVGGQGGSQTSYGCQASYPPLVAGGWNGGGTGGGAQDSYTCSAGQSVYLRGAGGGGASDIRTSVADLATRLIVAGGGGGGSYGGGLGGGQNGTDGVVNYASVWGTSARGGGATTTAGGAFGDGVADGTSGTSGQGGNGGYLSVYGDNPGYAGGGGGGYYGGGGGGVNSNYGSAGSGGGGSGYISGGSYEIASQGYRTGNGVILVSW